MKRIACLAALVAVSAMPAFGQTNDFQALLTGKDNPTAIQLKDLNGEWKRIAISAPDGPLGNMGDMMKSIMPLAMLGGSGKGPSKDDMMGMSVMSSLFGGGGPKGTVYYTRGLTTTIGGETFLIAYKVEAPQMDFMKLIMESAMAGGKEPDFAKMAGDSKIKAETPLTLTLVNVKSIGTMGSIRPFDLEKELAESSSGGGGLMDLLMMAGQRHEAAAPTEAVKSAPAKPAKPAKPANK